MGELSRVDKIKDKLNHEDIETVVKFGVEGQNKLEQFSKKVLGYVQERGVSEVGYTIKGLVNKLEESKPEELGSNKVGFFARLFGKEEPSVYERTAKYQRIESEVDGISFSLRMQKEDLEEDNEVLDDLYERNLEYYRELGDYIQAGELKIEELKEELRRKEDIEYDEESIIFGERDSLGDYINRLEKRVHNLKITRQITMQQAPQIRLIQKTNTSLIDRIDTTISTAIPLWKNQISITMAMMRKREALGAQKDVSKLSKMMIEKTTEEMKEGNKEAIKSFNKKGSDVEELDKVQKELMNTLKEALEIHEQGTVKIQEAESNLDKADHDLKDKVEGMFD